jgi:hypothetical protein
MDIHKMASPSSYGIAAYVHHMDFMASAKPMRELSLSGEIRARRALLAAAAISSIPNPSIPARAAEQQII